jgi:multidrug efflux pump subunit AcrA (membrane-fusion protein)
MIQGLIRYLVFVLVAAALVYGGYRMLTPATTKTTATEKAEKDEHSNSVVLSDAKVAAAGIELAKASPGVLRDSLLLNGMVQPNQESLVQVTPRFPGIVRDVRKRVGDRVQKGDVLAVVESNQSLTSYELKAALAGTVIDRQTTLGEYVSEQKPAFVIADLSTVWIDFSVYRRDLTRVNIGDQVFIDPTADRRSKPEFRICRRSAAATPKARLPGQSCRIPSSGCGPACSLRAGLPCPRRRWTLP